MYTIVRYVIFHHNLYRDKKVYEYSHFCTKGWCTWYMTAVSHWKRTMDTYLSRYSEQIISSNRKSYALSGGMLRIGHKVANVTLTSGKWTGGEHCEPPRTLTFQWIPWAPSTAIKHLKLIMHLQAIFSRYIAFVVWESWVAYAYKILKKCANAVFFAKAMRRRTKTISQVLLIRSRWGKDERARNGLDLAKKINCERREHFGLCVLVDFLWRPKNENGRHK